MNASQEAYKILGEISEGRMTGLEEFFASHQDIVIKMGFFHDAARYNNVRVIEFFLEKGFSPNMRSVPHPKQTPLYIAALHGSLEVAKRLLDAGANIEEDNDHTSATPLLGAVSNGQIDMVRFLIDQGANVHAEYVLNGKRRLNALILAARFENNAIESLLRTKGVKWIDDEKT